MTTVVLEIMFNEFTETLADVCDELVNGIAVQYTTQGETSPCEWPTATFTGDDAAIMALLWRWGVTDPIIVRCIMMNATRTNDK